MVAMAVLRFPVDSGGEDADIMAGVSVRSVRPQHASAHSRIRHISDSSQMASQLAHAISVGPALRGLPARAERRRARRVRASAKWRRIRRDDRRERGRGALPRGGEVVVGLSALLLCGGGGWCLPRGGEVADHALRVRGRRFTLRATCRHGPACRARRRLRETGLATVAMLARGGVISA